MIPAWFAAALFFGPLLAATLVALVGIARAPQRVAWRETFGVGRWG